MATVYGLHIPNKGKTWVYDFQIDGVRYSKSTKQTRYAEAVKVASRAYEAATGNLKPVVRRERITLRAAFGRFYEEKAKYEANHKTVIGQLERLALSLGPDLYLDQITMDDLLRYQSKRRQEVSNRTVNAEVPELIRRVNKRAAMWGVETLNIDWSGMKLQLPAHRTRSASRQEQARLLCKLRKDYRRIVLFALRTGLRKSALFVKQHQIDWDDGVLTYKKKSKRTNDIGWLPLTPSLIRMLAHENAKAPALESVFTYKAADGSGRFPITASGLRRVMQTAIKNAGLQDWRLIHDLRHTAATELLRSSQNLVVVQKLLGHSEVSQTARYAHALMDDVREAMKVPRKSR